MELTCAQMDVLISFYIDKELSEALRQQVEEHLKHCSACRAKYDIISSMIADIKGCYVKEGESTQATSVQNKSSTHQYQFFKNNLSAYIDNELNNDDSLKVKKFTINNKKARKELEDNFNIRKLMNDSFKKCKTDAKRDFSKSIIKQLELEEEAISGIHPAVKLLITFMGIVFISTLLVLINLSM